jgi:hypothetical protein
VTARTEPAAGGGNIRSRRSATIHLLRLAALRLGHTERLLEAVDAGGLRRKCRFGRQYDVVDEALASSGDRRSR